MTAMSTPSGPLRLALCQLNATVGDIAGNERKIRDGIAAARGQQAQLVLFPELALTGYPPEDLLLKEHFLRDAREALDRLAAETEGIVALVGFPERDDDVHNALAVLADGEVKAVYRKNYLPNYGVFDEQRYFAPGDGGALIEVGGVKIGLTICEDIWEAGPPASDEAYAGASVIVNLSASPYHAGKGAERERMLIQRARTRCASSPSARSSAARTSSSSTVTRSSSTTAARSSRGPPSSARSCWSRRSTRSRR